MHRKLTKLEHQFLIHRQYKTPGDCMGRMKTLSSVWGNRAEFPTAFFNEEILSSTSRLPCLCWLLSFPVCPGCSPSLAPQGLSLALVHTQQQSLPVASELRQESLKTQEWRGVQNHCRAISDILGPFQLRIFRLYGLQVCSEADERGTAAWDIDHSPGHPVPAGDNPASSCLLVGGYFP